MAPGCIDPLERNGGALVGLYLRRLCGPDRQTSPARAYARFARRLVGCRGDDSVRLRGIEPFGRSPSGVVRAPAVLSADDLAFRRDAVYLADFADLLPLHLLRHGTRRSHAALLDQYGRDGDLHALRSSVDCEGAGDRIPDGADALSQRVYVFLLGDGDLVDSDADHSGNLAPRLPKGGADLRFQLLGSSLSAGHVHGLHVSTLPGHGAPLSDGHSTGFYLRGARCLGPHLRGHAPAGGEAAHAKNLTRSRDRALATRCG